jgi:hypothetical protein
MIREFIIAKLLVLMLSCLVFSLESTASTNSPDPYIIVTHSPRNSGAFNESSQKFHKTVTHQAQLNAQLISIKGISPIIAFNRGIAIAMQGRKCHLPEKIPVLRSQVYSNLSQYLITIKSAPVIDNIEKLKGKTLARQNTQAFTHPSEQLIRELDITIYEATTHGHMLEMLITGRVAAIIASPPLLDLITPKKFYRKNFNFAPEKPFYSDPICYIAQDTPNGKHLINQLNQAIDELRSNGELDNIRYLSPRNIAQETIKTSLIQDLKAFEKKSL